MTVKNENNFISGDTLLDPNFNSQSQFPDISDLSSRLKFVPQEGRIWLDDRRMFLMHNRAFGELRKEMISSFGIDAARGILTRMGYQSGTLDAQLASKVRKGQDDFDAFATGPQMHALLGIVKVEPIDFLMDQNTGKFYGEYFWHDSIEDDSHIETYGIGEDAACWMQIGYASGYTSAFMGRPVLFREVECRSAGAKACRIIGKPQNEWNDAQKDIYFLHNTKNLAHDKNKSPFDEKPANKQQTETKDNHKKLKRKNTDKLIIGTSSGFRGVQYLADKVAKTDATVSLLGESGVGKEVFAQYIHDNSLRKNNPFIVVNCAAIPEDLIESELFGVEKGAYTGADKSRMGRFERADSGTIFLDEIHTLSFSAQGKVMRVIQEGELERLGGTNVKKVDIRIITATNIDLKEFVRKGEFRQDLFFRINVFPIHIPPLRDRRADIPLLMEYFLDKFTTKHNKSVLGFSERATMLLFSYAWPGNIREMENVVERGVILAEDCGSIKLSHLLIDDKKALSSVYSMTENGKLNALNAKEALAKNDANYSSDSTNNVMQTLLSEGKNFADIERDILSYVVQISKGNLSAAARQIGLTRPQLAYRLEKLGIKA